MLVTLFQHTGQTAVSTIEWTELMRGVRDGRWREIVERCRREATGGDEMRRRLPAFGVSVTFLDGDEAANVVRYTHVIAIDFNKIVLCGSDGPAVIARCREVCRGLPSVVGFYVSKSRRGFRLFVKVNTGIAEHKRIYHPLQEYFEDLLGLHANDRYKDITQLSYVSHDPDCFFRDPDAAEPFAVETICPGLPGAEAGEPSGKAAQSVADYLGETYDIRYNVRERAMQCRRKGEENARWHNIGERLFDLIVADINAQGIALTYNQLQWALDNYAEMATIDEAKDYAARLPQPDNDDHIAAAAALLNANGGSFAPTLTQWLTAMWRGWMYGEANRTALALCSDAPNTGKTEWAMSLVPPELQRYTLATSAKFMQHCPDNRRSWLLIMLLDFDGDDWPTVEKLMEENPEASLIITAQAPLTNAPSYVKPILIGAKTNANATAEIANTPQLYAQIKANASV